MSDGTCCHYCNRYTCICDRADKAEIAELPQGAMIWAVFLPDATMPVAAITGRDAAVAYYKANEPLFDRGYYRLRRIKVGASLGHEDAKMMLVGLSYARRIFEQYAEMHEAKGDAEKAERNQSHADAIKNVIQKATAGRDNVGA